MVRLLDTFTAARILGLMRTMLTLWVVCWGMGAEVSHAQTCSISPPVVSKNLQSTVRYSVSNVSGAKVLDSFSSTLTLKDCKGFPPNSYYYFSVGTDSAFDFVDGLPYSSSSKSAGFKYYATCYSAPKCYDINNSVVPSGSRSSSGIALQAYLSLSGTDANGNSCINIQGINAMNAQFQGYTNAVLSTIVNNCVTIVAKLDVVVTQETAFSPSNAVKIPVGLGSYGFAYLGFGDTNGSFILPNRYSFSLGSSTYVTATGTCALSLSNSNIDMGMISPAVISFTRTDGAIVSKPLTITVNNCTGYASGKNKVMQWVFKPSSSDLTRMENAIITGGSTGISAQIVADSKYDMFGNLMDNRFITSGENYITSGKTSDNQTLNYRVYLVRNTDAVKAGAFSSTATVTLSYQ